MADAKVQFCIRRKIKGKWDETLGEITIQETAQFDPNKAREDVIAILQQEVGLRSSDEVTVLIFKPKDEPRWISQATQTRSQLW